MAGLGSIVRPASEEGCVDVARIIALANRKGGVAKTTSAVNIAASLMAKKQRVLLIDCDPQMDASTSCGVAVNEEFIWSLYNVFCGDCSMRQAIRKTAHGFDIIPAIDDLAGFEVETRDQFILKRALVEVDQDYDYIILDLPPSLGMLTVNGLVAAHSALIPLTPEVLPLFGARKVLELVQRVVQQLNPDLIVEGGILTRYDDRLILHRTVERDARALFSTHGSRLMTTKIKNCVRFSESPAVGEPTVIADTQTIAVQGYHRLVKEALGL